MGIGNPGFGDDGVGAEVVEALKGRVASCHLLAPSLELLEKIKKQNLAIVVDAVNLGLKPGEIVEFTFEKGKGRERFGAPSHTISLEEIVTTGYELFPEEMPEKVIFIGVQIKETPPFTKELSQEVREAIPEVVKKIEKLINFQNG